MVRSQAIKIASTESCKFPAWKGKKANREMVGSAKQNSIKSVYAWRVEKEVLGEGART